MRYRTHQVKTQKTQRFVVNLFSNLNGFKVLNDIDLLSTNSLPSILKLSRLSIATYFNNQGVLSDAAADTARFDYGYDGTNWVNQGLLVEKQSTNHARRANTNNIGIYFGGRSHISDLSSTKLKYGVKITAANTLPDQFGELRQSLGYSQNKISISAFMESDANTPNFYLIRRANSYAIFNKNFEYSRVDASGQMLNAVKKKYGGSTGRIGITFGDTLSATQGTFFRFMMRNEDAFGNDGGNLTNKYMQIFSPQLEVNPYITSFIPTESSAVTRAADNLQLNVSSYTGSVKLTYKRQDTDVIETKWVDYTDVTNPVLSNQFNVGVWLHKVVVYNRILTAKEKANA